MCVFVSHEASDENIKIRHERTDTHTYSIQSELYLKASTQMYTWICGCCFFSTNTQNPIIFVKHINCACKRSRKWTYHQSKLESRMCDLCACVCFWLVSLQYCYNNGELQLKSNEHCDSVKLAVFVLCVERCQCLAFKHNSHTHTHTQPSIFDRRINGTNTHTCRHKHHILS